MNNIRFDLIIGGLGLFLFGIKYMGDGLKSLSGDKLRDSIDKYTSTPLKAILIGALITALIQSSSGTTALTIGLIRAGLMRLDQSVGIIIGANIGTTITSFLIGIKIENFALYFIAVGASLLMFFNKKKYHYYGEVILGFGVLFFGLKMMGDELKLLKDIPQFTEFANSMAHSPLLSLFAGAIMTALIQSSSAVIGILQKMYESNTIQLSAAIPFLFGSNIGTTVTAILSAIGGSLPAKRSAGIHVIFNVLGSIIFIIILKPFESLVLYLTDIFNLNNMMQISMIHMIFNITTAILVYPFINYLVILIKKILPGEANERIEVNIDFDKNLASQLPSSALQIAKNATIKMGEMTLESLHSLKNLINDNQGKFHEQIIEIEGIINSLDRKTTDYLLYIALEQLSQDQIQEYNSVMRVTKDIERISDHITNIGEFLEMVYDNNETLSQKAVQEVNNMIELAIEMLKLALNSYQNEDLMLSGQVTEKEEYMDNLEAKYRTRHFNRISSKECSSAVVGSVYVDILSNLERIGDHCDNIANVYHTNTNHDVKED